MCPVERERDPSACRASGLTTELPVHVVLVPPMLVPPLLVPPLLVPPLLVPPLLRFSGAGSAAASSSGAGTDGETSTASCLAIFWIALGSFVFARCGGYKQAPDFTRAGHRIVQSTLLLSFILQHRRHTRADVYPTDRPTSQFCFCFCFCQLLHPSMCEAYCRCLYALRGI